MITRMKGNYTLRGDEMTSLPMLNPDDPVGTM